ncbi:MAG: hypothetical protein IE917_20335, partial [Betaproteobacteria bacterium]|nr:hypothetical protein [Betaproteobacteria bacterium]
MASPKATKALPTVAALSLLYGLFGQYIPGEFGHAGTPLASFLGLSVSHEPALVALIAI